MAALGQLVALALTASSATPNLAAPGFSAINVSKETADYYSDHFAQQLTLRGLKVLTATDISQVVGLERQKQLLGCSEGSSSCMAELANALGADGIITGSVGLFGTAYQLDVRVVATDARVLGAYSQKVEGDQALLEALDSAAAVIAPKIWTALGRTPPPEALASVSAGTGTSSSAGVRRTVGWTLVGVGGAAAIGAVATWASSNAHLATLQNHGDLGGKTPAAYADEGANLRTGSAVLGGVALAAVASGAFLVFGASDGPRAQVAFIPGRGGAVSVQVDLP